MLKPTALAAGHYECRSLKQSLPILQDLLALEVITTGGDDSVLKHPNTGWKLIAHDSSPDAPDKPFQHHYGVRVATNGEIDRAHEYLQSKKREYKIKIIQPKENHNAYSVHFFEPGGNFWEIESYEKADGAGMGKTTSPHWQTPIGEEQFPGRGYIPQALTHGTVQFENIDATRQFYENVLGLEVVQLWPSSIYVKHRESPWYIVNLPFRADPILPTRAQRFVLAVESASKVEEAHQSFSRSGQEMGVTAVDPIQRSNGNAWFVFSDLNRNWWELTNSQ
jgi:catechol 2,3-dioxygenase-like lactoylglutathione lyase family enzyme